MQFLVNLSIGFRNHGNIVAEKTKTVKKNICMNLFFDKSEDLQLVKLLKLNIFSGTFQIFCPQLQLVSLKNIKEQRTKLRTNEWIPVELFFSRKSASSILVSRNRILKPSNIVMEIFLRKQSTAKSPQLFLQKKVHCRCSTEF